MRRAVPVLLAALLLGAPAPGAADAASDLADARAHFRRGSELYAKGRYRQAIGEFEAAYRIRPHAAIRFNVAQCHEKLGELPQALRGYHDYLREVPQAEDRAKVRASMRRIEDRLAATGVQALLVSSEPAGAEVRIDGRARGTTPFVIALPPGTYAIAIERGGYAPVARQVSLTLDALAVVDARLEAASASGPAPIALSPVPVPPSELPDPVAKPDLTARAPAPVAPIPGPAPSKERHRVWTWVAAGVAAAAVGVGAYYGVSAQQKSAELRDGSVRSSSDANALAGAAQTSARNANVLYAVGGAAAAAGVTLFVIEGRF